MAKKQTKAVATRKTTAVSTSGGNPPAYLAKTKMVGATASSDVSDNLIPMVAVLQKNSPQVEKRGASYVKGSEPGDIYIKNLPNPVVKGEEGFIFQPCYFEKGTVEWLPRNKGGGGGGGFIAMYKDKMPGEIAGSKQAPHPEDSSKKIWLSKDGNLLVETRYYGGFIIEEEGPMPAVIPFASSGHTVAKNWNMLMRRKTYEGQPVDMCVIYYRFTTLLREKGPNSWYILQITDAGDEEDGVPTTMWAPTKEDVERGQALATAMQSGAREFNRAETAAAEGDPDKM